MMIKGIARHSYSVPLFHFSIIPFPLPIPRRYREVKCRTPVGIVFGPKTPAVGLDDRSADGQPHAKPVALGGVKRLKDLIELVPSQARSTVAHGHLCHATAAVPLRLQHHSTFVHRTVLHRVKRIEQQIEDDLLQLYPVALHCRQVWKFEIEIDVEQGGVAVDQPSNIADYLREVEGHEGDDFLFY